MTIVLKYQRDGNRARLGEGDDFEMVMRNDSSQRLGGPETTVPATCTVKVRSSMDFL